MKMSKDQRLNKYPFREIQHMASVLKNYLTCYNDYTYIPMLQSLALIVYLRYWIWCTKIFLYSNSIFRFCVSNAPMKYKITFR